MIVRMEIQDFVKLGAMIGVEVAAFLVCWLIAIRTRNPKFKQLAKYVAIFGFAFIGMYGYMLYQINAPRPDFVTDAVGPARGMASVSSVVSLHVAEAGEIHHVELTPRADADATAKGTIELPYKLEYKSGKILVEASPSVEPAEGRQWRTVSFAFTPEASGDLILKLQIPAGVDMVHVVVKDPR
jgi:hypothetical protein